MPTALYTRDILRLAASIPHLGPLDGAQARVEKSSPLCGSRIAVSLSLDRNGRVTALGQEVKACALGQAAAALLGEHAIGRNATDLADARDSLRAYLAGARQDPGGWPGLELFAGARAFPARHASILLAFDAAAEAAEAAPAHVDAG